MWVNINIEYLQWSDCNDNKIAQLCAFTLCIFIIVTFHFYGLRRSLFIQTFEMKIQYLVNALLLLNQAPSLFASQCLPDLETFFRTKTSVKIESVAILQSNEHLCLDHPFCQVDNTFWIFHFKASEQTYVMKIKLFANCSY